MSKQEYSVIKATNNFWKSFIDGINIDNPALYNDPKIMKTKEFNDYVREHRTESDYPLTPSEIALQFGLDPKKVSNYIIGNKLTLKKEYKEKKTKEFAEKIRKAKELTIDESVEYKDIYRLAGLDVCTYRIYTNMSNEKRQQIFSTYKTEAERKKAFEEFFKNSIKKTH